ncbi:hypothetical protein [Streptomyces sp. Wb2n-11]|uniref:hypothetical protein n=1 Tax=Streptomyces sp. Wb2n-11 TaxID=1030533 RepID=UPI000B8719FE|nr:hypothetical protein [Streptomyces sp. Wb2n-11]
MTDLPQRLGRWTAARLGVHPSIFGVGSHTHGFVLPAYLERSHDQPLRAALRTAAKGTEAVLVVVRGSSCTGKTRAAYEAVQHVGGLAEWDRVFPVRHQALWRYWRPARSRHVPSCGSTMYTSCWPGVTEKDSRPACSPGWISPVL